MKKYQFNVLLWDINAKTIIAYDVLPYFQKCWKKQRNKENFQVFGDYKQFIDNWAKYRFWSRCEYEFIISPWPPSEEQLKIDIYDQIKMNLDLLTEVFIKSLKLKCKDGIK